MKTFTLRVKQKLRIVLSKVSATFQRGIQTSKTVNVPYNQGSGQELAAGTVLHTAGTPNQIGYVNAVVTTNATLTGSGTFNVSITRYPSTTQPNNSITYIIDGTQGTIDLFYNSAPVTVDIIKEVENREVYFISLNDFVDVTDYDGEAIGAISFHGNVSGYMYNGNPYVSGTWVSTADLAQNALEYRALDQDAGYDKTVEYKVRDINGNESLE